MTILIKKEDVPQRDFPSMFLEFFFKSHDGESYIGRIDSQSNEVFARRFYSNEWLPAKVET